MLKFGKKKKAAPEGDQAEAEAPPPEAEDGEEGAPARKKKPMLLIIGAAAALVLVVGGAGTWFLFLKPSPAGAEDGHAPAEKSEGGHGEAAAEGDPALGQIRSGPDGVTFYTMPDLIVNIQSADGRPTFLKLKLTLEMSDPHVATRLQGEAPRLQDMFQGFLRELRPEDLAGSAGSHQLRMEILRRVNLIAAPGKVDAVLIEEMLVQ